MLGGEIIRRVYAKCIGVSYPLNIDFAPFEKAIAACVLNGLIIESSYQSSLYYEYYDPGEASVLNYDYCCWCHTVGDDNVKQFKPISRLTSNGATNAIKIEDNDLKYLFNCISSASNDVSKFLLENWPDKTNTTQDGCKRLFCKSGDCIFHLYNICNKNKRKQGRNTLLYKFKDSEMLKCAQAIGYINVPSHVEIQTIEHSQAQSSYQYTSSSSISQQGSLLACSLCLCSDENANVVYSVVPGVYVPFLGAISMSMKNKSSRSVTHMGNLNMHLDIDNIRKDQRFCNVKGDLVWCPSCKKQFYQQFSKYKDIFSDLEMLHQHTTEERRPSRKENSWKIPETIDTVIINRVISTLLRQGFVLFDDIVNHGIEVGLRKSVAEIQCEQIISFIGNFNISTTSNITSSSSSSSTSLSNLSPLFESLSPGKGVVRHLVEFPIFYLTILPTHWIMTRVSMDLRDQYRKTQEMKNTIINYQSRISELNEQNSNVPKFVAQFLYDNGCKLRNSIKAFRRTKQCRGTAWKKPDMDPLDDDNSSQESLLEQFVSEDMRNMLEHVVKMGIPDNDELEPQVQIEKQQFSDDEDDTDDAAKVATAPDMTGNSDCINLG